MTRLALAALLVAGSQAHAHQPVMDMAPRWAGGYGVQTRIEHFDSRTTTWLEGVYTFDPAVRVTLKLPYSGGELGGPIVGVPLKRYVNAGPRTSNWGVTPSVQLPAGEHADWDLGLSVSYSAETPRLYQMYDLYTWGDRTGLDINVGLAFPSEGGGVFALWDVSALHADNGDRVQTGPVFVYFRRNVMFRAEYKAPVWDRGGIGSGAFFNVGIGVVY